VIVISASGLSLANRLPVGVDPRQVDGVKTHAYRDTAELAQSPHLGLELRLKLLLFGEESV
jgi:hypothetical protein